MPDEGGPFEATEDLGSADGPLYATSGQPDTPVEDKGAGQDAGKAVEEFIQQGPSRTEFNNLSGRFDGFEQTLNRLSAEILSDGYAERNTRREEPREEPQKQSVPFAQDEPEEDVDSMTNREFGRYYSRKMFPAIAENLVEPVMKRIDDRLNKIESRFTEKQMDDDVDRFKSRYPKAWAKYSSSMARVAADLEQQGINNMSTEQVYFLTKGMYGKDIEEKSRTLEEASTKRPGLASERPGQLGGQRRVEVGKLDPRDAGERAWAESGAGQLDW
jgi:hypothetical protein